MKNLELDLEEISQWRLRYQGLLIVAVIMAIQAAGYVAYLQPKLEQLQGLKQQERQHWASLERKTNQVSELPKLQRQIEPLSQRYFTLSQQFALPKELAAMLAAVNQLALQHSLGVIQINWGAKQSGARLESIPLHIELTGDYHSIGDFATALAAQEKLIHFEQITWQRVNIKSSQIHFKARAIAYQRIMEASHAE